MGLLDNVSVIGGADGPTAVFVAGILNTQVLIVSIVVGIILCIFGLRLMRILSSIVGILIGAGIGAGVGAVLGLEGMAALAVIAGCGLVMALVSFFLKRVGAFLSVFCYAFGALMTVFPKDLKLFILIAGAVALVLAVLAAVYMEPVVVIISSIAGGLMAGPAIIGLLGMDEKMWIGYIVAIVFALVGVIVQLLMQSGKIKKKDKQLSQKFKEEASRESDVEKARMILDDEDDADIEIIENKEDIENDIEIVDDFEIQDLEL